MERCSTTGIGQKMVINVCDGANLGYVTDIEFEICEGKIVSLIVGDCTALGFSKEEVIRVPWCKIKCIGEDVILVDIAISECTCQICSDKDKKKRKKGIF